MADNPPPGPNSLFDFVKGVVQDSGFVQQAAVSGARFLAEKRFEACSVGSCDALSPALRCAACGHSACVEHAFFRLDPATKRPETTCAVCILERLHDDPRIMVGK